MPYIQIDCVSFSADPIYQKMGKKENEKVKK